MSLICLPVDYSLPRTRLAYLECHACLSLGSTRTLNAYSGSTGLGGNFQLKAGGKNPSRVCAWAQLLSNTLTLLLNFCDCVSRAKSNSWRSKRNWAQVAQDAHGRRLSWSFLRGHNTALYSPPSNPDFAASESSCSRISPLPLNFQSIPLWFMLHGDILLVCWDPCEPPMSPRLSVLLRMNEPKCQVSLSNPVLLMTNMQTLNSSRSRIEPRFRTSAYSGDLKTAFYNPDLQFCLCHSSTASYKLRQTPICIRNLWVSENGSQWRADDAQW